MKESHHSIVHVRDAWYIAATGKAVARGPVACEVLDTPLVLFRAEGGRIAALLDRCAHRNVPLSAGRVKGDEIECGYHGWRFGEDGVCRHVPTLTGPSEERARRVASYPVREQQGYVWVYMNPDERSPGHEPYRFPHLDDGTYSSTAYSYDFSASVHATLENILDVPHTAFLHRGLFRNSKEAHEITVLIQRYTDRVEAEFVGEPRPGGVMGSLLAPTGGTVEHRDRFLLPSVAEVDYRLGQSHLLISSALTPLGDFRTRMHAVASLRFPLGGRLISRVLRPFAMKVVRQDARMLTLQTRTVRRFEGERFASTAVDVLGAHILRLLRRAARGEARPSTTAEPVGEPDRITMRV